MRVKLNFITNGVGNVTATCVAVTGLADYEMPNEDFIVLHPEELCIGGSGISYGNKTIGYVQLMKGKKRSEKKRFEFIRDEILFNFINAAQEEVNGFDPSKDSPIQYGALIDLFSKTPDYSDKGLHQGECHPWVRRK